ncbi:mRNA decay activator protein ZFP36L2-like [Carassius auratus]|uniref:mRNA decay activator protein ZFP36 n=1 Tax=Carassius auratus TaxID=7957 RepID=A0A6P6NW29_CARAU|nr:mRNA decay activator protein ZFP36L2-like [Carassius auratus]XP_052432200.1 mRNA decay activator protein ZFP36L2-like [Carassius gibelio]
MSDTLGESLIRNLFNLGLDEPFLHISRPVAPKSVSSERLTDDVWLTDTWSQASKPQFPLKADRSMSLTDTLIRMKPHDVPPPPGFPPMATLPSNRYKTELCRSFQEYGTCKYGSKCQFAHGESELRGLNRHPKYKTQACRTFYQFGYCPYGSRCHFIHEDKNSLTLDQNPRQLRQSVSFAGFTRSNSPPTLHEHMSFTRAPSVSPPPADILSPVFSDSSRDMFPFSRHSTGDIYSNAPFTPEPRSRCVCGHGNNSQGSSNMLYVKEDLSKANLQRFSSEDSLSDRESYSSTGSSSGSESPTFDSSSGKRLSVFTRMSVSD